MGSYAMMGTGDVLANVHSVELGPGSANGVMAPKSRMYDAMEWRVRLVAPDGAHGIRIHYIFFSTEYDEYVGSAYNDKFFIFLRGDSQYTSWDSPINITDCRGANHDGTCTQQLADIGACDLGEPYCYIAINSALSECCWKNGCPDGTWTTNIAGTGFVCAKKRSDEMILGLPGGLLSEKRGSSTGWLATEWPVEPGEKFELIFHIHDTRDGVYDSQVIIDKVIFVGEANAGTVVVK